jgi:phenylalanine-4-hydroxylase
MNDLSLSAPIVTPRAIGGNDPRCVPIKLTRSIPVGDAIDPPAYTEDEQAVWRTLQARQQALLPGRAADEFLSGLEILELDRDRIPALRDVSRRLFEATGWQIARTPGLSVHRLHSGPE